LEDGGCGAGLYELAVFVDEGDGIRFYFVIAGEAAFRGFSCVASSLLMFGEEELRSCCAAWEKIR
jgi:hypothetical protein